MLVAEESTACYRVREQLVRLSLPSDAVGCTSEMEGQIVVQPDGTIVQEESYIRVNLDTLTSDESRRDRYIKNNTLNTAQYPEAVFVPTALEGVPTPLPTTGEGQFRLVGQLTIRDVTREVVWDVTARATGNRVEAQATTAFTFDDFQLTRPRVPVVLSIEDPIRLEVTTVWERVE